MTGYEFCGIDLHAWVQATLVLRYDVPVWQLWCEEVLVECVCDGRKGGGMCQVVFLRG